MPKVAPFVNLDDLMDLTRIIRYWHFQGIEHRFEGMSGLQNVCTAAFMQLDQDLVLGHKLMEKDIKLFKKTKEHFKLSFEFSDKGERYMPGDRHLELWLEVFRVLAHPDGRDPDDESLFGPCKKPSRAQLLVQMEKEAEDMDEDGDGDEEADADDLADEIGRFADHAGTLMTDSVNAIGSAIGGLLMGNSKKSHHDDDDDDSDDEYDV